MQFLTTHLNYDLLLISSWTRCDLFIILKYNKFNACLCNNGDDNNNGIGQHPARHHTHHNALVATAINPLDAITRGTSQHKAQNITRQMRAMLLVEARADLQRSQSRTSKQTIFTNSNWYSSASQTHKIWLRSTDTEWGNMPWTRDENYFDRRKAATEK